MTKIIPDLKLFLLALVLICSCKKVDEPQIIKDGDGNVYNPVTIGTQVWLKENLKTTKYNDGSRISGITDPVKWKTANKAAYCWFGNDSVNNKSVYGALYNLYAVNSRKLCPVGWHVPDNSEWNTLFSFTGGVSTAGNQLKETGADHWRETSASVTNSTGFTALPGGLCGTDGSYLSKTFYGYWWSSGSSSDQGSSNCITYESGIIFNSTFPGIIGLSVRCLKNK
jgi:uncharacterized protein (TIGR02145 family)